MMSLEREEDAMLYFKHAIALEKGTSIEGRFNLASLYHDKGMQYHKVDGLKVVGRSHEALEVLKGARPRNADEKEMLENLKALIQQSLDERADYENL